MASRSPSPLVSAVRHSKPRLVVPAKWTPRELKELSDIDDQEGLRFQVPIIMFYKSNPSMEGKDPAQVIREALSKALVFYYPFAGRLVEGPNRKLKVDCTSEGVLFIEAETDARLDQIGYENLPAACPYLEELLHDVPGSDGILGCPLLLIQVTRFGCGGFSFAMRLNHTMCDAFGLVQLLNAIAEFAQGNENAPSVHPVWQRELLTARQPPRITRQHHEYEEMVDTKRTSPVAEIDLETNLTYGSFFFGLKEIRSLRNRLPPHQRTKCSSFELMTACLWICRTLALGLEPNEIVRISCTVNGRGKHGLLVPQGYYGNVFAFPAAVSKAAMLCTYPFEYVVELIKNAKAQGTEEYLRSVADFMVTNGRPVYIRTWNCFISDTRHSGFDKVDFGWGKPIFGGVARAVSLISFFVPFKDSKGQDVAVLKIGLPQPIMKRFEQELNKMTREQDPWDTTLPSRLSKLD